MSNFKLGQQVLVSRFNFVNEPGVIIVIDKNDIFLSYRVALLKQLLTHNISYHTDRYHTDRYKIVDNIELYCNYQWIWCSTSSLILNQDKNITQILTTSGAICKRYGTLNKYVEASDDYICYSCRH